MLSVPPSVYYQPEPGGSDCLDLFIEGASYTSTLKGQPNILGQVNVHVALIVLDHTSHALPLLQPLMEAYYTIFDRANKRVGFAPIAGCGSAQPALTCNGSTP